MIGSWPENLEKCVVIVVPHTSWHDFYMGLLIRRILGADIKFVAKKELFQPPFGWYFRWMGGISLDRTSGQNKVEAIADIFRKKNKFKLAIAPEGTRKKVSEWKTGFYYIARAANVPIIVISIDYGKKKVKVSPPIHPGNDLEEELREIKSFCKEATGKVAVYT